MSKKVKNARYNFVNPKPYICTVNAALMTKMTDGGLFTICENHFLSNVFDQMFNHL